MTLSRPALNGMRSNTGRHAIVCDRLEEGRLVRTGDMSAVRLAQSNSRLHQRIEYGFQIEGRTADYLEHVGGRRLLLEGLSQFVEQPRVLDGDDSLSGKVLKKRNLGFGKRMDCLPSC